MAASPHIVPVPDSVSSVTGTTMTKASGRNRIPAIDVLRGLVMVVMVLDHARDFYFGAARVVPTNLSETTPTLFFTRWVTHFCAPVFVFLAGTSARIYQDRRGVPAAASFLLTRGLVLVLLEITVVRLCWVPDPFYRFTLLQVIWVIGWSMVVLSAAVRLPERLLFAIGAAIVLLHDVVDGVHAKNLGALSWLWTFTFERGALTPLPGHRILVTYPLVPWFGVMLVGYSFGKLMLVERSMRRVQTRNIGLAAIAAFVMLRVVNVYGDPVPWSVQRSTVFTVMSFLNCQKYPPSLLFTLMTLGPALVLLSVLDRESRPHSRLTRALAVLGGVPLFFYVGHLVLLRYTSAPLAFARFGPSAFQPPPGHGGSPEYDLWVVYVAWVLAVLLLYLPSRWFLRKKETHPASVLKYL